MQFNQNANVVTGDGKSAGRIDRVVLDPVTKQVTHAVVRKGLLFAEDKVVPIDLIASATGEQVTLRDDAGDLQALPNFQETHYVHVKEEELGGPSQKIGDIPRLYWYPPMDSSLILGHLARPAPSHLPRTEENIPPGTVALNEGAHVISRDYRYVGNVLQVWTDPRSGQATHLVISMGLVVKQKKLIPTTWVRSLGANEVRLVVDSRLLEELREYEG